LPKPAQYLGNQPFAEAANLAGSGIKSVLDESFCQLLSAGFAPKAPRIFPRCFHETLAGGFRFGRFSRARSPNNCDFAFGERLSSLQL
jgi:hypothetical protein